MLDRLMARVLKRVHDRPLPQASDAERLALTALKRDFEAIPIVSVDSQQPSERAWLTNMNRLRALVLSRDARRFLRWKVVAHTMFVAHAPYVRDELRYLQQLPDWESRWRKAIVEDNVGHPNRYFFYPASSANLIHHAYHVAHFEERTGCRISEMDHIVEFGGGYGSLCRLAHRLGFRGRYVIFDLPAFSALQRFFLRSLSLPVLGDADCTTPTPGICCVSDLALFRQLCAAATQGVAPMFIATWSLSEAPLALRGAVADAVSGFSAFLIGYQERFGEVDNVAAFDAFMRSAPGIDWRLFPFELMAGNYYLFGVREPSCLPSADTATPPNSRTINA